MRIESLSRPFPIVPRWEKNACILQLISSKNGAERNGLYKAQANRRVDLVGWVADLVGLNSWGTTLGLRIYVAMLTASIVDTMLNKKRVQKRG